MGARMIRHSLVLILGLGAIAACGGGHTELPDAPPGQPDAANPADAAPDAMPVDTDGDGIADATDNCPLVANPGQEDGDIDGIGVQIGDINAVLPYRAIQTLLASATSVSFTGIPSTLKTIEVTWCSRDDLAGFQADTLYMRVNNDAGGNYRYNWFHAAGLSPVACRLSRNLHPAVIGVQRDPARVTGDMRSIISPVIRMDRVAKSFGGKRALDHVSATIHPGHLSTRVDCLAPRRSHTVRKRQITRLPICRGASPDRRLAAAAAGRQRRTCDHHGVPCSVRRESTRRAAGAERWQLHRSPWSGRPG